MNCRWRQRVLQRQNATEMIIDSREDYVSGFRQGSDATERRPHHDLMRSFPKRLLSGVAAALTGLAGAVAVASPASAAVSSFFAHAQTEYWDMSHTVTTSRYNPAGGAVEVLRSSRGSYRVRFGGLGSMLSTLNVGGIAHVHSFTPNYGVCTVGSWLVNGPNLDIQVNCFNHDGTRLDTKFFVNFIAAKGTGSAEYSYLWADQPLATSYVPHSHWRWDIDGGTATIERSGVGTYRVYLPASVDRSATQSFYQVTGYSGSYVLCKPSPIVGGVGVISVRCLNHAGNPIDARFTVSYAGSRPLLHDWYPTNAAYISVNSSGVASVAWSSDSAGNDVATVTRFWEGWYRVRFGDGEYDGHAMVTATGLNDVTCTVAYVLWVDVEVHCHDSAGVPRDTRFYVGYRGP
jgi:hypothetical protein